MKTEMTVSSWPSAFLVSYVCEIRPMGAFAPSYFRACVLQKWSAAQSAFSLWLSRKSAGVLSSLGSAFGSGLEGKHLMVSRISPRSSIGSSTFSAVRLVIFLESRMGGAGCAGESVDLLRKWGRMGILVGIGLVIRAVAVVFVRFPGAEWNGTARAGAANCRRTEPPSTSTVNIFVAILILIASCKLGFWGGICVLRVREKWKLYV